MTGQYDESYNDIDTDADNRDSRQLGAKPYAYMPPSKSCARVSYGRSNCGGLSPGDGGGCDTYCIQQGYPFSFCRNNYCLCHRGEDLGRECEVRNGK